MDAMEIEYRINLLRRELDQWYSLRRKAKKEQEDFEETIIRLDRKKKEIEMQLQETVKIIERRIRKVSTNSKFKSIYLRNAKAKIFSGNSKKALNSIERAKVHARKKHTILDDDIAEYSRKIYQTEQEIQRMKEKLFQMGDK